MSAENKSNPGQIVIASGETFMLSALSGAREMWALHEMGGMQPRVGWIGCVHGSMGYLTESRRAPDPSSQWIFGYQSLQEAAEALVAEKRSTSPVMRSQAPELVISSKTRKCDGCNRDVLVIVTRDGQTKFANPELVAFIGEDGIERIGNAVHKCRRR